MAQPTQLTVSRSGAPSAAVRTVCSYCGVGCGIAVESSTGPSGLGLSVVKATGDKSHPANAGRLCTKGATHVELMLAPGRMSSAHLRRTRGEAAVPVPLDTAVAEAGARLRAI